MYSFEDYRVEAEIRFKSLPGATRRGPAYLCVLGERREDLFAAVRGRWGVDPRYTDSVLDNFLEFLSNNWE